MSLAAAALTVALSTLSVADAFAANECRVQYGWKTSGGSNRSTTIYLNAGQIKTLNLDRMRYVRNRKNAPVRIRITNVLGIPPAATASGAKYVTLQQTDSRDPPSGSYFTNPKTKLYNIKCNASTSSAGTSGGAAGAVAVSAANAQKIANFIKALNNRAKTNFLKLPVTKQISIATACATQTCLAGVAALAKQGTTFARNVLSCLKSSTCKSRVVTVGRNGVSNGWKVGLASLPTSFWSGARGKSTTQIRDRLNNAKAAKQLPASLRVTTTVISLVAIIVVIVVGVVTFGAVAAVVAVATMVAAVGISTAISIVTLFV